MTSNENINYIDDQIIMLKQFLKDTDYQAIKHSEGELSDEEFEPIKQKRQSWREQIRNLSENPESY